jgi:hypothetical protein
MAQCAAFWDSRFDELDDLLKREKRKNPSPASWNGSSSASLIGLIYKPVVRGSALNALEKGRRGQRNSYCFGALGSGGARRSAWEMTAIDRAPFLPTDRTAKK